jgi:cytochrome P450
MEQAAEVALDSDAEQVITRAPATKANPGTLLAPMPPADPVLGHLRRMRSDPFGFLTRCMGDYGDVVRLHFLRETVHLISHPDHIRYVLQKNWRRYDKRTRSTEMMALILGKGLVTSGGDEWMRQRKLAQPSFHTQKIGVFSAAMTRLAEQLAERWEGIAKRDEVIDVHDEMMGIAIRVLQETLFGLSSDPESVRTVAEAVQYLEHVAFDRFVSRLTPPIDWPTPVNRRFRSTLEVLDRILYRHIDSKRRSPGDDLLTMLMEVRDEEGKPLSDRELRDQIVTLLLAGYDTTAATLTWSLYLLSKHPESQRRMNEELRSVLGERAISIDDLPKLPYSRGVIQESMRLYPAVWLMKRRADTDDEIGGYHIPANSGVFVSPWVMHRHPAFWENPEGFDPTRFSKFKAVGHAIPGYLPFGDGPRICIGNAFALTEVQIIMATLVRRFRVELVPGHTASPTPLFAVAPKGGMPMRVRRIA